MDLGEDLGVGFRGWIQGWELAVGVAGWSCELEWQTKLQTRVARWSCGQVVGWIGGW